MPNRNSTSLLYNIFLLLYGCFSFLVSGCAERGQDQSAEPDSLSLHFKQELLIGDDGKLEGVGRLEKFTFEKTVPEVLIPDIWKDQEDRFYVIDKRGTPVVQIGCIKGL